MSPEALCGPGPVGPPTIVIAEDNQYDQLILRRVFRAARPGVVVLFVDHGGELLDYLCGRGRFEHIDCLPAVVFLDLNMPQVDGWAALEAIRKDGRFGELPVIVMSTLTRVAQVEEVHALGASSFFTKPTAFAEFVDLVRERTRPWLDEPRPQALH